MVVMPLEAWVSPDNLDLGIQRYHQFGFDGDFHNGRYARFLEWRRKGVTRQTWTALARELREWGALRGITESDIQEQSADQLQRLDVALQQLLTRFAHHEPSLDKASWLDVEPLFQAAASTNTGKGKPIVSPVLPSKLCHFLAPGVSPIADHQFNSAASLSYHDYWEICQDGWARCEDRTKQIARLRAEILRKRVAIIPEYPWVSKIVELCYAGFRNHP